MIASQTKKCRWLEEKEVFGSRRYDTSLVDIRYWLRKVISSVDHSVAGKKIVLSQSFASYSTSAQRFSLRNPLMSNGDQLL